MYAIRSYYAVFFRSREELLEKVVYYLGHEDERREIALSGLRRCRTGGYSHRDRVAYMVDRAFSP